MDKIPVTLRALVQRINRHLAHREEVLKKARGAMVLEHYGEYYILNTRFNSAQTGDVDPVALARELGLLKPWEVAEGEGEPDAAAEAPAFDPKRYRLGLPCKGGHLFEQTGLTLRNLVNGKCPHCAKAPR